MWLHVRQAVPKWLKMASPANSLKRKNSDDSGNPPKKSSGFWNQGLKTSMEDPKLRVEEDDDVVIIKDKYPKARFHYLVLPKKNIANLKSLKADHIPLLKHMQRKGETLAARAKTEIGFRFGYHAVPSMSQVHLHVISQDFDSPCLKTKKHWNSFATEYFIDSEDVIQKLEDEGHVQIDTSKYQQILKRDLRCHECQKSFATMPALKKHLVEHIPKSERK